MIDGDDADDDSTDGEERPKLVAHLTQGEYDDHRLLITVAAPVPVAAARSGKRSFAKAFF